jgi:hypothetical protein
LSKKTSRLAGGLVPRLLKSGLDQWAHQKAQECLRSLGMRGAFKQDSRIGGHVLQTIRIRAKKYDLFHRKNLAEWTLPACVLCQLSLGLLCLIRRPVADKHAGMPRRDHEHDCR